MGVTKVGGAREKSPGGPCAGRGGSSVGSAPPAPVTAVPLRTCEPPADAVRGPTVDLPTACWAVLSSITAVPLWTCEPPPDAVRGPTVNLPTACGELPWPPADAVRCPTVDLPTACGETTLSTPAVPLWTQGPPADAVRGPTVDLPTACGVLHWPPAPVERPTVDILTGCGDTTLSSHAKTGDCTLDAGGARGEGRRPAAQKGDAIEEVGADVANDADGGGDVAEPSHR